MKAHENLSRNSHLTDSFSPSGTSRQLYCSTIRSSPSYIHSDKPTTSRSFNFSNEVNFFNYQQTDTKNRAIDTSTQNASPDVHTKLTDCELLNQNSASTNPHTSIPSLTMSDITVVIPKLPHKPPEPNISAAVDDGLKDIVENNLIESKEDVSEVVSSTNIQVDDTRDEIEATTEMSESDSTCKLIYKTDDLDEGWLFVSKTRRKSKKTGNYVEKPRKSYQVDKINQNEFKNRFNTDLKRHKSNRKVTQTPLTSSSVIHTSDWSTKTSKQPIKNNRLVTDQSKFVVASPRLQNSWFSRQAEVICSEKKQFLPPPSSFCHFFYFIYFLII